MPGETCSECMESLLLLLSRLGTSAGDHFCKMQPAMHKFAARIPPTCEQPATRYRKPCSEKSVLQLVYRRKQPSKMLHKDGKTCGVKLAELAA